MKGLAATTSWSSAVVQLAADPGRQRVQLHEVDDEGVAGVVALGFEADVEIVAMDVFAHPVEGDEVGGVEMQLTGVHAHGVTGHGQAL